MLCALDSCCNIWKHGFVQKKLIGKFGADYKTSATDGLSGLQRHDKDHLKKFTSEIEGLFFGGGCVKCCFLLIRLLCLEAGALHTKDGGMARMQSITMRALFLEGLREGMERAAAEILSRWRKQIYNPAAIPEY